MGLPQPGIFALGNLAHTYLEFDSAEGSDRELTTTLADIAREQTTMSGVTVVVGLQPELWARVAPTQAVSGLTGFTEPVKRVRQSLTSSPGKERGCPRRSERLLSRHVSHESIRRCGADLSAGAAGVGSSGTAGFA